MEITKFIELYERRTLYVEGLSPKTVKNRLVNLRYFERYLKKQYIYNLEQLQLSHVKDFFAYYASTPGRSGQLPKHNSIDTIRKHIRYWLKYLQYEEGIEFNFDSNKVKGIGVVEVRKCAIDRQVIYQVTRDITDPQLKLMNILFFESGIRIGELVTLRAENITKTSIDVLGKGRHGGKWRTALIPEELGEVLLQFCRERQICQGYVFRHWQHHRNCCEHIAADTVRQKLKPYYARYDVNFTPHLSRHTFAQTLLKNGADLKTIQECLGHTRLDTTQKYLGVPLEHIKSTYDKCMPSSLASAL